MCNFIVDAQITVEQMLADELFKSSTSFLKESFSLISRSICACWYLMVSVIPAATAKPATPARKAKTPGSPAKAV